MYVASSVARAPVHKRFSPNVCQSCAILTHNAPSDCKKPSANLAWFWEGRQEPGSEASWVSLEVEIRSCVWFATILCQILLRLAGLAWMTGDGSAACATGRSSVI